MKTVPKLYETREYIDEIKHVLDSVADQIPNFVDVLYQAYVDDKLIFLVGNGGSAANASHFGQDLSKGTLTTMAATKRFRAIPLTDNTSFITALANDEGYESVFVEQLVTLARPADLLIAISGSGNSRNVLRAVDHANTIGMTTIGITGFDGGLLCKSAKVNVHVPSDDMGLVEAVHSVIFHLTVSQLKQRIASSLSLQAATLCKL